MQQVQLDKKLLLYFAGIVSLIVCLALLSYGDFIHRSFLIQPRVAAIKPQLAWVFLIQGVLMIIVSWLWLKFEKGKGSAPLYDRSFVKRLDRFAMKIGVFLFGAGGLIGLAIFIVSLVFLPSALPFISIGFFVSFLGLIALLTTFTMPIVQK